MRNYELLRQNIAEGLQYIERQQQIIRPIIDKLSNMLVDNMSNCDLTYRECLDMYLKLMEQETNSILVISKLQEIQKYTDNPKN